MLESKYLKNFPNPFNKFTTIEYHIPASKAVTLTITDLYGRIISEFHSISKQDTGTYLIKLDGINFVSGTYLYTLKTDNFLLTNKMNKIE